MRYLFLGVLLLAPLGAQERGDNRSGYESIHVGGRFGPSLKMKMGKVLDRIVVA